MGGTIEPQLQHSLKEPISQAPQLHPPKLIVKERPMMPSVRRHFASSGNASQTVGHNAQLVKRQGSASKSWNKH
jgi:hypothetical protein